MRCNNCGFETPNNSNFCSHCGAKIEFTDAFVDVKNIEEKEERINKSRYKETVLYGGREVKSASIMWYFLGFFVPMAAFILYYCFIFRRPAIAYKLRLGALHGLIVELVGLFAYFMVLLIRNGGM